MVDRLITGEGLTPLLISLLLEALIALHLLGRIRLLEKGDIVDYYFYVVELVDGRVAESSTILRGCTLNLLDHPYNIDLVPVELVSFDVIIGTDWLSKYYVVIVCDEKFVRIPSSNEVLTIHEDGSDERSKSKLSIISCTKIQKCIQKGCYVFLAQITEKKAKDK
ncbi:putative reverse transcriptase domain-containing protein [Tanacetum coccineum]